MLREWLKRIMTAGFITCISTSLAAVSVDFSNTTLPQSTTNDAGVLTLQFSVDAVGGVLLDASTTAADQSVIDAMDAWDGPVGTVSYSAAFNSVFSLELDGVGGSGLKLTDNGGGGLGVGGQNAWRVDRPGVEFIGVDTSIPGGKLRLSGVSWNHRANTTVDMELAAPDGSYTNSLSSLAGTWDLSGDAVFVESGQQLMFGNADLGTLSDGYALAGLSFDLVDAAPLPQTADLTPDTQTAYTVETFDGKTAWVSVNANGQLYFDVPGSFGFSTNYPVYARVEYHDDGQGRLQVEYDSHQGDNFKDSEVHSRSSRDGREGYVYSYHMFEYPEFAGGQNGSNDFRFKLSGSDGTPLRIASVQISTTPYLDERFQYALSRPWLLPNSGPVRDFSDRNTLSGKVMAGYQGWFGYPNDNHDDGWGHWNRKSSVKPSADQITIDMWPYLDHYDSDSLYPAGDMVYSGGGQAHLFSSADPKVVNRHFRWMKKYNIDGIYLQRFVTKKSGGLNGKSEFVLDNVRKAAAAEGRVWAIEYDVSSLDGGDDGSDIPTQLETITNDWNYLVNECDILNDPRYLHENGKPVLFIWGFGTANNVSTAAQADPVISWFTNQNLHLIGGVARDKINDPEWQPVLRKYDQILEWMEKDHQDLDDLKTQLDGFGMKILPHSWPGFSWHNLKQFVFPYQYTARNGGDFYWERLFNAMDIGADQLFLGMFDEYDEATAIMPMSDIYPDTYSDGTNSWGHYIDNEGLDPFWYLRLSGAAREILNGQRSLSSTLPTEAELTATAYSGDDATIYLGATDVSDKLVRTEPGDGVTAGHFVANHNCRTNAGNFMYFDIDDAFCNNVAGGQSATIEIEYHDDVAGRTIGLQYDSLGDTTSDQYKTHALTVTTPGAGNWKNVRWNVEDGFFANRQNGGSDFRVQIPAGNVVAIRRVSIFLPDSASEPNYAPVFVSDPVNELDGQENLAYSGTIADDASDPDSDPLTFSRVSGPTWLSVASDGTLSGMPGSSHLGLNSFTVQVDAKGGSDTTTLRILVNAAPDMTPPAAPTGLSAVADIGSISLDWADNTEGDLASYTVYRGTTSESYGAALISGLTSSDYVDGTALNHTTYYYVVTASDTSGNESVDSGEVSGQPGWVSDPASSDIAIEGAVSGTLADADLNDNIYQTITEIDNGSTSALEHKWVFDVTGAELVTFYVEAHHSANAEGDDFVFSFSTDDVNYTDMVSITKTSDDNTAQYYALPSSLSGTVYIRVLDADRTAGNTQLDTISVDAIFITSEESSMAPVVASNPAPADGAEDVAVDADLSWTAGQMAASHDVYFGTSPSPVFQGNLTGAGFDPGTLLYGTTYYWAIDEVNNSGTTTGPVWSFTTKWTEVLFDDFESGLGNWVSGGVDAFLSANYSISNQCLNIQDNSGDASSAWLTGSLDLTGYSELKIEFTYMPISMDKGTEDFWVRFSDDGGSSWTTIKAYVVDTDFTNGTRENPVLIIDNGTYDFTSDVKIGFQCDASGNQDDIYLDDVRISAK